MAALLGAMLACGPTYFQEDEVRAGVSLDWGPQQDRDGLEDLVAQCEATVEMTFSKGAAVKFVSDANAHCGIPTDRPVAGCWIPHFDLVLLEPAPLLAQTALCHELLHRQLFVRDRSVDSDHRLPEWISLSALLHSLVHEDGNVD